MYLVVCFIPFLIVELCHAQYVNFHILKQGICEDMTLEFYLVTYDNIGGVTCRRFREGYTEPKFWLLSCLLDDRYYIS